MIKSGFKAIETGGLSINSDQARPLQAPQVLSVETTPYSQGGSTYMSDPHQRQVSDLSRRVREGWGLSRSARGHRKGARLRKAYLPPMGGKHRCESGVDGVGISEIDRLENARAYPGRELYGPDLFRGHGSRAACSAG